MVDVCIDDLVGRKLLSSGQINWLLEHSNAVQEWIDDNLHDRQDEEEFWNMLKQNVTFRYFVYQIMKQRSDWNTSRTARFERIINKIGSNNSSLTIVLGQKGKGKTTLAFTIAWLMKKLFKKKIIWFGAPVSLPQFFDGISTDIDTIPENSFTVIDEAGLFFSPQRWDENQRDFTMKLATIRHASKSFIVIVQSSRLLSVQFFRHASSVIWTSDFLISSRETERIIIGDYLRSFMPKKTGEILYYDNENIFEAEFNLPKWWNEKYSSMFSPIKKDSEAYKIITKMETDEHTIQRYLSMRNYNVDIGFIRQALALRNEYGKENLLSMPESEFTTIIREGFSDRSVNDLFAGKKDYVKYDFDLTLTQKETFMSKIQKEPELELTASICRNRDFLNEIKKMSVKRNLIISLIGFTGTGKSYAMLSLAELIGKIWKKPFSADNIVLPSNVAEKVSELKEKNTIAIDEQPKRHGIGSGTEMSELQNIEEMIRKRQINLIYCSPSLRTHQHHFILETHGIDEKSETSRLLLKTPDNIVIGYITLSKPSKKLVDDYESGIKKDILNAVETRTLSVNVKIQNAAKEMLKDNIYSQLKNKAQRYDYICEKYPYMGSQEAWMTVERIERLRLS